MFASLCFCFHNLWFCLQYVVAAPYCSELHSFEDFLELSATISDDMTWAGLDGKVQLATFHPKYQVFCSLNLIQRTLQPMLKYALKILRCTLGVVFLYTYMLLL